MTPHASSPDLPPPLPTEPRTPKPFYKHLYFWVLVGVIGGVVFGVLFPSSGGQPGLGEKMKPLGEGFISLIKMLLAPIIFLTVVAGIAGVGDLKQVGRVGIKALVYFELVTTLAMLIALAVVHLLKPGAGVDYVPSAAEVKKLESYSQAAQEQGVVDYILHVIPKTFVGAFVEGEILQVLLVAILMGVALAKMGERARPLTDLMHLASQAFFSIVGFIVWLAPIAAFGAMASTVGSAGVAALLALLKMMAAFYAACCLSSRCWGRWRTSTASACGSTCASSKKRFCWCWALRPANRRCHR
jgi:aerobic C4-dicarboxylate transport protein